MLTQIPEAGTIVRLKQGVTWFISGNHVGHLAQIVHLPLCCHGEKTLHVRCECGAGGTGGYWHLGVPGHYSSLPSRANIDTMIELTSYKTLPEPKKKS